MAVDKNEFRRVLARFAAGVTVVTTRGGDDKPYGLTATAFTSVSLVPPLVLVCIGKDSESYPHFLASKVFAVNFLRHSQEVLSQHFAAKGGDKFAHKRWTTEATGAPILADVLGWVDCRIIQSHDAGDHTIHVGEVEAAQAHDDAPLLHYAAKYARIATE
ncbi:MAG TPA: flavin reductase family protein [Vicinamibacterales bacterium]|nr:flavin reductase family protein [Vicinamibacterales bacterium]